MTKQELEEKAVTDSRKGGWRLDFRGGEVLVTISGSGLDGQSQMEEHLPETRRSNEQQSPACWIHDLDTLGQ